MKRLFSIILAAALMCSMLVMPTMAVEADGNVTVSDVTANRSEEVTVSVTLSECRTLKSMMLKNLTYDATNLELVSGSWKVSDMAISSNLLPTGGVSSMALDSNTDINGVVYELVFRVKDTAEFNEYPIGVTVIANYMDTDKVDKRVTLNYTAGKLTVECAHDYSTAWSKDTENHWHECSICADKKDIEPHNFSWITDTPATEEATGIKHEECDTCGYKRNEGTVIPKLEHTHNMTHIAAVAATCTATGNIEYWRCTKCLKYYSDALGTTEITQEQTVTSKSAHTLSHTTAAAATCISTGNIEYWKCTVCNKYFGDASGTTEITQEQTVTVKTAHTLSHTTAAAATCTSTGNIEYWKCTVCNKYFSDAAGTTEITQEQTVLEKISHTPSEEWSSDAEEHWHACTECGEKLDKSAHTYEWVTDSEPTVTVTGTKHEECSICHHKRNEGTVIPKIGDANGDGVTNSDDAILLLNYTVAPSSYTIIGNCDFDKNGVVTSDDAIYLLNFTLDAVSYPLS